MSKTFYTNVAVWGGKILYRGIDAGQRVRHKLEYFPSLYVVSDEGTHKTIHGEPVKELKPGDIKSCRDFVKRYKDVSNFTVYGNQKYEYAYIAEHFPDGVDWDRQYLNIANIDLEVGSENGFPEPETASEPITAITIRMLGKYVVFGCGDFKNTNPEVEYIKCTDENDLIRRFIDFWSGNYPDAITGWNISFFDIPYLVNRITKLFGEKMAKRLSPWNVIVKRTVIFMGKERETYTLLGIGNLDYIELYRKFAPQGMSQESYKLDHICSEEIGEKKISYEEYGNLHLLYKLDYQKFIEYNIHDVALVEKLDQKLKLIDLALTLAYDSFSNYDDVFTQVRMWDNIIFNELRKDNIVLPPIRKGDKFEAYVGAYVKEPKPDMYRAVVSFDLNSLYPHLIMQYNISPDTFLEPETFTYNPFYRNISVENMLSQEINTQILKDWNVTLTPNGHLFTKEKHGFLPRLMEKMYDDRTIYKKKALEAKKEKEKETDPEKLKEIENRIARYNNLQLAKKVCLNSAYGALGSEYFRFFDVRQASAITTAGQLSIQWIERRLNSYLNKILKTENEDYVIASDTDSVYLNLAELVRKSFGGNDPFEEPRKVIAFLDSVCENKLQPFIDDSYQELAEYTNALAQKMFMKREVLADRGLWTAKKRYVLNVYNSEGVEYATPQIKITGLEMVRSSTPTACKKKLIEALDIIMNRTEDDMIKFISDFREEIKTLPVPDVAFPRGVNGIEKYSGQRTLFIKGTPIHVRGSIVYNAMLKEMDLTKQYPVIHEGEKIKFIYLREPNKAMSNIIAFPQILPKEFELEDYIDYDTQFEKSFLEPLKVLLDIIGWKTEKRNSVLDFF